MMNEHLIHTSNDILIQSCFVNHFLHSRLVAIFNTKELFLSHKSPSKISATWFHLISITSCWYYPVSGRKCFVVSIYIKHFLNYLTCGTKNADGFWWNDESFLWIFLIILAVQFDGAFFGVLGMKCWYFRFFGAQKPVEK